MRSHFGLQPTQLSTVDNCPPPLPPNNTSQCVCWPLQVHVVAPHPAANAIRAMQGFVSLQLSQINFAMVACFAFLNQPTIRSNPTPIVCACHACHGELHLRLWDKLCLWLCTLRHTNNTLFVCKYLDNSVQSWLRTLLFQNIPSPHIEYFGITPAGPPMGQIR